MNDQDQIDLGATIARLSELLRDDPIPIARDEMFGVLQEAHERSLFWMADLLFRSLVELGALPDGYTQAMNRTKVAIEYFRIASLYDFLQAKKAALAEMESLRRKSQGFEEPQLPLGIPDAPA